MKALAEGLIALPWMFLLGLIQYDAYSDADQRWAVSKWQRLGSWLWTHIGLILAILLGASITALGFCAQAYPSVAEWLKGFGGHELEIFFADWAPHFGPELIVLAFAAIFVEGALRKREQSRGRRFRIVQSLMYIVNFALQHHLYFDGGSSRFLEMERDAIEQRSKARRHAFWSDEQPLYDEAEKSAIRFIDEGLSFGWAVDQLNSARSALRTDLLHQEMAPNSWAAVTALEDNARAAFHRVPLSALSQKELTVDDLLDEDRRKDWEDQSAALVSSQTNSSIGKRLDNYFMNYWTIIELRVVLLNRFAEFQTATLLFRNRIWESNNPDE